MPRRSTGYFSVDIYDLANSLPVPGVDELPPRVLASDEDRKLARNNREFQKALLNPKLDTEKAVKYVLQSRLFGGSFRKDGDWVTLAGGRQVWQKKIADLHGGLPVTSAYLTSTYVEIKAVSPGKGFAFARLDKRNNPRQPSQFEKLGAAHRSRHLVLLAIGWWDALSGTAPIMLERGSRKITRWKRADVSLTITLLRWGDWTTIASGHKFRTLRQKDRHLLDNYVVSKIGGRWALAPGHWWPLQNTNGGARWM